LTADGILPPRTAEVRGTTGEARLPTTEIADNTEKGNGGTIGDGMTMRSGLLRGLRGLRDIRGRMPYRGQGAAKVAAVLGVLGVLAVNAADVGGTWARTFS
jgi:hypothetical protein